MDFGRQRDSLLAQAFCSFNPPPYSLTATRLCFSPHRLIHDFPKADGTLANGVNDFNGGAFPGCKTICAFGVLNASCMEMWGDHSCSNLTPETSGIFLGARRCKNSDGTMDFYNAELYQAIGSSLTYKRTTEAAAEVVMVQSNATFRQLSLVRTLLPILITVVVLAICCGVAGCCYCKKKKKCCFAGDEGPTTTSTTVQTTADPVV